MVFATLIRMVAILSALVESERYWRPLRGYNRLLSDALRDWSAISFLLCCPRSLQAALLCQDNLYRSRDTLFLTFSNKSFITPVRALFLRRRPPKILESAALTYRRIPRYFRNSPNSLYIYQRTESSVR